MRLQFGTMFGEVVGRAMKFGSTQIRWGEKFRAAGLHSIFTVFSAVAAGAVIFLVWYPGDYSSISGGKELLLLIIACELALGPLISLVIYNSAKPKAELVRDYVFVGLVQIGALSYGVYSTSEARPVFVAFTVDRLELIAAADVDPQDLAAAVSDEFKTMSWTGPVFVEARLPDDPDERAEILFAALRGGKDVHQRPKYYRSYDVEQVLAKARPIGSLREKIERADPVFQELDSLIRNRPDSVWLPITSHFRTWSAVLDENTGLPIRLLPINPFEETLSKAD